MLTHRPTARSAALLLVTIGSACHRPSQPSRAVSRDSGGVTIIESSAPLGPAHIPWSIDTTTGLDIGAAQDDPHQQLTGIAIARRLANSEILVATRATSELRYFDSSGSWLRSTGRKGQGPGEFESLGWVMTGPGDTLRTYDWGNRRLSVFGPTGNYIRSWMLKSPTPQTSATPYAVLANGTVLAGTSRFVVPGFPSGVMRDTTRLLLYSEKGEPVDSFGPFPGGESLVKSDANSGTVMGLPFGKTFSAAVTDAYDHIFVGSADRPEVGLWSMTGHLERLVRWNALQPTVTEKDRAQYVAAIQADAAVGQKAMYEELVRMVESAPLPAKRPAYARFLTGPRGSLWVESYQARHETYPTVYEVFDSAGQWLGPVTLPARFKALQVDERFLLGTWKDADDVEHVRLFRMTAR